MVGKHYEVIWPSKAWGQLKKYIYSLEKIFYKTQKMLGRKYWKQQGVWIEKVGRVSFFLYFTSNETKIAANYPRFLYYSLQS
jgi:hypothetical protein